MLRGNGGADIFFAEGDRYRFYLLMQEGIERYGHRVHAFCLMSNHVHLVIQVGNVSLSRIKTVRGSGFHNLIFFPISLKMQHGS